MSSECAAVNANRPQARALPAIVCLLSLSLAAIRPSASETWPRDAEPAQRRGDLHCAHSRGWSLGFLVGAVAVFNKPCWPRACRCAHTIHAIPANSTVGHRDGKFKLCHDGQVVRRFAGQHFHLRGSRPPPVATTQKKSMRDLGLWAGIV